MTAPVTLAISTRDRADALARCLAAVAKGTVLPAEVVVVDQSAGPETEAVCAAATLPVRYHRDRGSGLGRSQNLAFAMATQPIVAVTDDDCEPAPDWIATIEATLADHQLGGMAGRVLALGPPRPGYAGVSLRDDPHVRDFGPGDLPWPVGSGNNFAVRSVWLARIGGNDERLGPGAPGQGAVDMDLFHRLLRAGARLRYEPSAVVHHARAPISERMGRRYPYGHGMGAFFVLRAVEGDRVAWRTYGAWWRLRLSRLRGGLVREELLVLWGTIRGTLHGLRVVIRTRR